MRQSTAILEPIDPAASSVRTLIGFRRRRKLRGLIRRSICRVPCVPAAEQVSGET